MQLFIIHCPLHAESLQKQNRMFFCLLYYVSEAAPSSRLLAPQNENESKIGDRLPLFSSCELEDLHVPSYWRPSTRFRTKRRYLYRLYVSPKYALAIYLLDHAPYIGSTTREGNRLASSVYLFTYPNPQAP